MKTVFIVMVEEDSSFVTVCDTQSLANKRAKAYEEKYNCPCEVFEEELEIDRS